VAGLEEHVPWQEHIGPAMAGVRKNVFGICLYGFTEMLNNVIDHSGSPTVAIDFIRTADCIRFNMRDFGVGIFKKIQTALQLNDELEAITELAKGKLTTDPAHHTGEGIFFTSRMFDYFSILSGHLFFSHTRKGRDWLIENKHEDRAGTHVTMIIAPDSRLTTQRVFNEFVSKGTTEDDEFSFSKTQIPVTLFQYGAENLVSRSQAKRLLTRFEAFREVILDFDRIEAIGQAFADEIFRVYQNEHPDVHIRHINSNADVRRMIDRAIAQQRQQNPRS
jgi:hypothetical protein